MTNLTFESDEFTSSIDIDQARIKKFSRLILYVRKSYRGPEKKVEKRK